MQIIIRSDGSFESVAAVDRKQKILDARASIKIHTELLRGEKKALTVLQRIDRLKTTMKTATPARKEKIRADIQKLRMDNGVGPRSTLSGVKKRVLSLEKTIEREKNSIVKHKEVLKGSPVLPKTAAKRAPGDKARTRKTGPAKNQPTPKQRAATTKAAPKVETKKEEKIRKLKNDIQRYNRTIRELKTRYDRHPNIGMSEKHLERAKKELATLTSGSGSATKPTTKTTKSTKAVPTTKKPYSKYEDMDLDELSRSRLAKIAESLGKLETRYENSLHKNPNGARSSDVKNDLKMTQRLIGDVRRRL